MPHVHRSTRYYRAKMINRLPPADFPTTILPSHHDRHPPPRIIYSYPKSNAHSGSKIHICCPFKGIRNHNRGKDDYAESRRMPRRPDDRPKAHHEEHRSYRYERHQCQEDSGTPSRTRTGQRDSWRMKYSDGPADYRHRPRASQWVPKPPPSSREASPGPRWADDGASTSRYRHKRGDYRRHEHHVRHERHVHRYDREEDHPHEDRRFYRVRRSLDDDHLSVREVRGGRRESASKTTDRTSGSRGSKETQYSYSVELPDSD